MTISSFSISDASTELKPKPKPEYLLILVSPLQALSIFSSYLSKKFRGKLDGEGEISETVIVKTLTRTRTTDSGREEVEVKTKTKTLGKQDGNERRKKSSNRLGNQRLTPEVTANLFSKLTFGWIFPLLRTGYSQPIEETDIWKLSDKDLTKNVSDRFQKNFNQQVVKMPPSETKVDGKGLDWDDDDGMMSELYPHDSASQAGNRWRLKSDVKEEKVKEKKPKKSGSGGGKWKTGKVITLAIFKTFRKEFLLASMYQLLSGGLLNGSTFITKELIAFMGSTKPLGYGIGMAIILTVMQLLAALLSNHFFSTAMLCGMKIRSALIDQVSRKSLRLSGKSRVELNNGRMTSSVAGDCSFLDFAAPMTIQLFTLPVTIIVGIILLIISLGPSSVVGVGVLLGSSPLLSWIFKALVKSRDHQMMILDKRNKLVTEVLGSIRGIKLYGYEDHFMSKIGVLRGEELQRLKRLLTLRAIMISVMTFMPVLAAILSFVTYSLSGHSLDPAKIFAAHQLFNILAEPLRILPVCFTSCTDALVAAGRLQQMLLAEEITNELDIDPYRKLAIRIRGDFSFESIKDKDNNESSNDDTGSTTDSSDKTKVDPVLPFQLQGIDISINKGEFVVIFGRIGSGKSALLQAMIGEMEATKGEAKYGGRISYCQQQSWVQNATLRDNIAFGAKKVDQKRLRATIKCCALKTDIELLPDGLSTEIGERGVTLSGGQKARVCLARCVYSNSDIYLLDDPLSAVDSKVSSRILQSCLLGELATKTRVLVTHNLDVLPYVDKIIVLEGGKITQQGTYNELKRNSSGFRTLMQEFASIEQNKDDQKKPKVIAASSILTTNDKDGKKLTTDEERSIGKVGWKVYKTYLVGMTTWLVASALFLVFAQVSQVGTAVFLGYWSEGSIKGFSQGEYMAIYATFGLSQAILAYGGSYATSLAGLRASLILFRKALNAVIRSPLSFHDTTPTGRVLNRLTVDIENLDFRLMFQWNAFATNLLSVVGTIGLVIYSFAYLGFMFIPMVALYYFFAVFYRRTSREVKRVDSNLKSHIYSSFSEQLDGLPTIRAFQKQNQFITNLQKTVDVQSRAYYLTIILQRWLGVRLDLLGNILVLGVAIFGAAYRHSTSPAKLGVVLTYTLQGTQLLTQLVSTFSMVEQEMNNVERVAHYGALPVEAPPTLLSDPPTDEEWPQKGTIQFHNVKLKYRDDLPLVLKGLTLKIKAGEKIGIVGRTGAGKSSIVQALFRTVELSSGSIWIDGINIESLGLDKLRRKLSVIPQDALLFAGDIRSNLDPLGMEEDDLVLNDALRRCGLIALSNSKEEARKRLEKFRLDGVVTDGGSNFSGGEKQLLALARALIKGSKVLVLDEATSNVDVETDKFIQRTIRREFKDVTLLCIAHRLATIAFYDKVMVLDQGEVVEFDNPLRLFDQPSSVFRSMCVAAGLTRDGIRRIRGG